MAGMWVAGIASVVCFGIAACLTYRALRCLKYHCRVNAEVVRYWVDRSDGVSFFPVLRFEVEGKRRHAISSYGGSGKPWRLGSRVLIAYDPENPKVAGILQFGALWLFPIVFVGFGVVAIFAAISSYFE